MATREQGHGDLAERQAKLDSKYDIEVEQQVRVWMEMVTGEPIVPEMPQDVLLGPEAFQAALKDGMYLCHLMNAIVPGSCKPKKSKIAFMQMENIGQFLTACEKYGVKTVDMFQTVDLYDNTNFGAVIQTILALGRKCQSNNFAGPTLGPKESVAQPKEWTEEQLRQSHSIAPKWNQLDPSIPKSSGVNAGSRRQIIPDANQAQ
ncbi:myophilin-like [Symsagittifera roscoffensis]|uniref:myophilin-like n=1 Tax=Symsagittifera roscoffensis TaxID=84072 RepID=UPI00307C87A2